MSYFVYEQTEIGNSHIKSGTPLQDSVYVKNSKRHAKVIGCVSDGHGSKIHFYSEYGSSILCNVVAHSLRTFVGKFKIPLNEYKKSEVKRYEFGVNQNFNVPDNIDPNLFSELNNHFQHLFKNIIFKWNEELYKHWKKNKPTEKELEEKGIENSWVKRFMEDENIEVAYGCTLVAFVITTEYFFSFQLGDGSCFIFDKELNGELPIPNDPKCIGSTTTSMCEEDVLDNFRCVFQVNNLPVSIFIATDGLDGAFSLIDEVAFERLNEFYKKVILYHKENGEAKTKKELKSVLNKFANTGIKLDDIGLVCAIKK